MGDEEGKKQIAFVPRIDLGQLLSLIGFIVAGTLAYATLDKRLSQVEVIQTVNAQSDRERAQIVKESVQEVRSDIREMKKSLDALAEVAGRKYK